MANDAIGLFLIIMFLLICWIISVSAFFYYIEEKYKIETYHYAIIVAFLPFLIIGIYFFVK